MSEEKAAQLLQLLNSLNKSCNNLLEILITKTK